MHIPDGYLSPLFSLAMGLGTVPAWARATQKVQQVLSHRTVPLLAIFAALSFTIMMFNVPVPGGTTAHGVGGTLIAIILGPWAAVIAVSVALIIQALFFGDGGILAIFANCLNMAVILPFVGYGVYRLIAGRSPILATRRVWAAGIGAYIGITASALAVGIELGLQPMLFTQNGQALYSPYGLGEAIPAMLIAHALGASIVEGLITALGVAYFQKRHPEYLTELRGVFAPGAVTDGVATRIPLWQLVLGVVAASAAVLGVVGLIEGGGDPGRMFGADWSSVSWPAVGAMLVTVVLIGSILLPVVHWLLPRAIKRVGTAFAAVAIVAPLGLIAPGFAYGEGTTADVHAAFGYVPKGLQDLSGVFSAPFSGYNIPLPFFSHETAQLWQQGIGYEITGVIGILLVGVCIWGVAWIAARLSATSGGRHTPTDTSVPTTREVPR
jgi:cobalt/nickel transport system permease protein